MNYFDSIRASREVRNQAMFAGASVVSAVAATIVTATVAQGFIHGLVVFVVVWFYGLLALCIIGGTAVFVSDMYNDYKSSNNEK